MNKLMGSTLKILNANECALIWRSLSKRVQKARMFAEFRALALLDFITQNGIHPCTVTYSNVGRIEYPPFAKPYPLSLNPSIGNSTFLRLLMAVNFKKYHRRQL